MQEELFIRQYWNDTFAELQKLNSEMPDVGESCEDFISRLDDISIENEVTSFGYQEIPGTMPGVRATIEVRLSETKDFLIDINGDAKHDRNTKIKSTYVELSLQHKNNKEFLTNTFFSRLPYTVIDHLIKTLKNLDEDFNAKLLEYRKHQKMAQLNIATIKSLLTEKFKGTPYEFVVKSFSVDSFLIQLYDSGEEISRLIVDEENYLMSILDWQI